METENTNIYTLQSELFQEMNEERGIDNTPDVKSKSFIVSQSFLIIYYLEDTDYTEPQKG